MAISSGKISQLVGEQISVSECKPRVGYEYQKKLRPNAGAVQRSMLSPTHSLFKGNGRSCDRVHVNPRECVFVIRWVDAGNWSMMLFWPKQTITFLHEQTGNMTYARLKRTTNMTSSLVWISAKVKPSFRIQCTYSFCKWNRCLDEHSGIHLA